MQENEKTGAKVICFASIINLMYLNNSEMQFETVISSEDIKK